MAKTTYHQSPFGTAQHPWLNKPDTKFAQPGTKGVFKVNLEVSGAEAVGFADLVKANAEAIFEEFLRDPERFGGKPIKAADKDKWSVYLPYTVEMDDDGSTPTGNVAFHFKQNAEIKLKDGTVKPIVITVVDSKNKAVVRPVFSGTVLRVMYSMRPILIQTAKQFGVRLDFAAVQVRHLATSSAPGFSEVDGGYEADDDGAEGGHVQGGADSDPSGDY